jgi:hypothetical protein
LICSTPSEQHDPHVYDFPGSSRCDYPPEAGVLHGCGVYGGSCPAGRNCVDPQTGGGGGFDDLCFATSCSSATENYMCGVYNDHSHWLFRGATPVPAVCCSSSCSDLLYDNNNCGACGTVCPSGSFCNQGGCSAITSCARQANDQPCATASGKFGICCDGACVDYTSDSHHCGSCEQACGAGAHCIEKSELPHDARCVLPNGSEGWDCTILGCDPGWGCNDLSRCSPTACTATSISFESCLQGSCCAGFCSSSACGSVGYNCDGGAGQCLADGVCLVQYSSCWPSDCSKHSDADPCALKIDGGFPGKIGLCCAGSCIDPSHDPNNCGGCGLPCDACVDLAGGTCLPEGASGACNASCAAGSICVLGSCDDSTCTNSLPSGCLAEGGRVGYCCPGNACADLRNDPLNCGHCGTQCPPGKSCTHATCQP